MKLKEKDGVVTYCFLAGVDIVQATMPTESAKKIIADNGEFKTEGGTLYSGKYMFPIVEQKKKPEKE